MIPARFWRRYTAWSLDAAIVGTPIALLGWSYWRAGMHRIGVAIDAVATRFAELAIDGLRAAEHPLALAQAWLHDGRLHDAIADLETVAFEVLKPGLLAFVVLAAPYWIAFECSRWQATPGKRVLDLAVTDPRGERVVFSRAAARHAAGALSWLTLNLGHGLAAIPPQKRALHDRIARTRVMQLAETALPLWARACLVLQVVVLFAGAAWLMQAMQRALQSALYA